jgi:hyperosmotically inducible periplasmic protein
MRQFVSVVLLIVLFLVVVGSRFEPSDGDRLAAIGRLMTGKVRGAMPPAEKLAGPLDSLRRGLPTRIEDRVKNRLETDRGLQGISFTIAADGDTITLRGIVPDIKARKHALELAESTTGVEKVIDELAVPE